MQWYEDPIRKAEVIAARKANGFYKRLSERFKGRPGYGPKYLLEETKAKMRAIANTPEGRESRRRGASKPKSEAMKAKLREIGKQRDLSAIRTPEARKKIAEILKDGRSARYGSESSNWKGGVCNMNSEVRFQAMATKEYQHWRHDVLARDGRICQRCGSSESQDPNIILEAHHVKPWATHKELRFDVDNGQTLCRPCHKSKGVHRYKALAA